MADPIEFLKARLDEDEAWARAACQAYPYAEDKTLPADGVHWRWVAGEDWHTVTPDPVTDTYGNVGFDEGHVNLATVEEWPTGSFGRTMPRTYANEIVEMDSSAAGHIARHDPARVLREVEAKRAILGLHEITVNRVPRSPFDPFTGERGGSDFEVNCSICGWASDRPGAACLTVRHLASAYSNHPDFDPSWVVTE